MTKDCLKVVFITTVRHNVGDDFVREGLRWLIDRAVHDSGRTAAYVSVHKHSPVTVRRGLGWVRQRYLARALERVLPVAVTRDEFDDADVVVQSGAPVYWCHAQAKVHCFRNEWFSPFVERRIRPRGITLLNLAAGSCQGFEADGAPAQLCSRCRAYIAALWAATRLTTVRDHVASTMLESCGFSCETLPCSSIFAARGCGVVPANGQYVALNFMEGAGHFRLDGSVDAARWRATFHRLYQALKQRERVVLVCHDEEEVALARTFDVAPEIFFAKNDAVAYMRCYAAAKYGLLNRVHGALMLASLGKPAIVVGSDSRAQMVREVGLRSYFANAVSAEQLGAQLEALAATALRYPATMRSVQERAATRYVALIKEALSR